VADHPALRLAADPAEADSIPGLRSSVRLRKAAAALDCDLKHLRLLLQAGDIEGHRIGKRGLRVYVDSLRAYQERRPIEASAPRRPAPAPRRPRHDAGYREAMASLRAKGIL